MQINVDRMILRGRSIMKKINTTKIDMKIPVYVYIMWVIVLVGDGGIG